MIVPSPLETVQRRIRVLAQLPDVDLRIEYERACLAGRRFISGDETPVEMLRFLIRNTPSGLPTEGD